MVRGARGRLSKVEVKSADVGVMVWSARGGKEKGWSIKKRWKCEREKEPTREKKKQMY